MESIFASIAPILTDLEYDPAARRALVMAAWPRAAGELLDKRTRAIEYLDGKLTVAAEDETWCRHLRDLSPQLIAKINTVAGNGSLSFIEFVADLAQAGRRENLLDSETHSESVPPASVELAANAIADESLREKFLEAAAAYLDRKGK